MSNSSGTWIESVSPSLVEGVVSAGVIAGGVGGLVNPPGFSVEEIFDSVIVSISCGEVVCSGFLSVTSSSVVATVVVVVVVAVVVEVVGVVVVVVVEVGGLRTTVGLGLGGDDVEGGVSPDLGLSILTRVL